MAEVLLVGRTHKLLQQCQVDKIMKIAQAYVFCETGIKQNREVAILFGSPGFQFLCC